MSRHLLKATLSSVALVLTSHAYAAPFVLAYTDGQEPAAYTNLQAYYSSLSAVGLRQRLWADCHRRN